MAKGGFRGGMGGGGCVLLPIGIWSGQRELKRGEHRASLDCRGCRRSYFEVVVIGIEPTVEVGAHDGEECVLILRLEFSDEDSADRHGARLHVYALDGRAGLVDALRLVELANDGVDASGLVDEKPVCILKDDLAAV